MTTVIEHAVLCANGKVHYDDTYLRQQDHEQVRRIADRWVAEPFCGGGPHVIASRERIVTDWQVVA